MRRTFRAALALAAASGVAGGLVLFSNFACSGRPDLHPNVTPSFKRSQALYRLASQEAAKIDDRDARLTRLLNMADGQVTCDWDDDAIATLASASATLASAEGKSQLNDHARLAGWVSVSQLSRGAGATDQAEHACAQAVTELRAIEDGAERCQYVIDVANELQHLSGEAEGVSLLKEAAAWTKDIDDLNGKRQALLAFAGSLFNLNAFEAGQAVLQQEDDPAWRADILLTLAQPGIEASRYRSARSGGSFAATADQQAAMAESAVPVPQQQMRVLNNPNAYGKRLNYGDVFRGQQKSRTQEQSE